MDQSQSVKTVFASLLQLIAAIAFGYFALQTTSNGLQELKHLRQLERIPQLDILGIIPGEAILSGNIISTGKQLTSPRAQVPSVYYRYLVEKRCKDSDGNESWCTQSNQSRFVAFNLQDQTGEIAVVPSQSIDWQVPQRYQQTSGEYRYTEWRLEHGDFVNSIGYISNGSLRFDQTGQYLPIVTTLSVQEARGDVGHYGLLWLWGGLSLGMAGIYCFMLVIRVHRVLAHVTVLTAGIILFLSTDGFSMIRNDLSQGQQRLKNRQTVAENEITQILIAHDYVWPGWSELGAIETEYQRVPYEQLLRVQSIYDGVLKTQKAFSEHANRLFGRIALVGAKQERDFLPTYEWNRVAAPSEVLKSEIKGWAAWGELVGACVLAFLLGFFALRTIRWKRLIENVPTSKIKGIMPGLSEIKAHIKMVDGIEPLVSPLKSKSCVYYHYQEKEKRGTGKNSRWVTITNEKLHIPFFATDDSGNLQIDLGDAEIISKHQFSRSSGRRRYSETIVSTSDELYAIGDCKFNSEADQHLLLGKGDSTSPYIVSNYPESVVMLKKARLGMGMLTVSFSSFMLMLLVGFGMSGDFAFSDIVFAGLAAPLFGFLVVVVLHYNDLIFLQQRVGRNWANIDVLLQKRFDLYNSLQPVVSKMLAHEKELLEQLRFLRSESTPIAGDTDALKSTLNKQSQVAGRIVALGEAYPELNSNKVVTQFMSTLSDMETEISLVRSGYNDAVETYNGRVESFPEALLAKAFGFKNTAYRRW